MNMKYLRKDLGFTTVVIIIAIVIAISLLLTGYVPEDSAMFKRGVTEASADGTFEVTIQPLKHSSWNSTIWFIRVYDRETGVLCYLSSAENAMSCIKRGG